MRSNVTWPLVLFLIGGSLSLTTAAAEDIQLAPFSRDISPPSIKHEPINGSFNINIPLTIEATVSDQNGVKEVTLFYRTPGIGVYRAVRMNLKDSASNLFSATIPGSEVMLPKIEYYLQATDISGNTVVRAGKMFPLTIAVKDPNTVIQPQNVAASGGFSQTSTAKKPTNYWYWIIGGTIAAIAVAANVDNGKEPDSKPSGSIAIEGSTP